MSVSGDGFGPFSATRLAPSPTGALHLGHARTFLLTYWMARQAGAKLWMRMEDLDAGRAKSESVQQAYDDLRWLGITWDLWPAAGDGAIRPGDVIDGAVVQSQRTDCYEEALEMLWQRRAVYPCTCSRAQVAASVAGGGNAPHAEDGNVRYPGTCRGVYEWADFAGQTVHAATELVRARTGKNVCWRLRVEAGAVAFVDVIAGAQAFDVARDVGDFPVTRFAGAGRIPAAYQLACVVDDHAMAIDRVIRGDDLLSSTPRQLLLYRALGWTPPQFAHVPLVIGPDGKRLAKRHGESRIAQFRAAGVPAERVIAWAAWRSGQGGIDATNGPARFDPARLPRSPIWLDETDRRKLKGD